MVKCLLYVFGLSRSGNHGIIQWIQGMMKGSKYHFNNQNIHKKLTKHSLFKKINYVIISFEDIFVHQIHKKSNGIFIQNEKDIFGHIKQKKNIIILRDPLNLFASKIKHSGKRQYKQGKDLDNWLRMWMAWAKESLNIINRLPNKITIIYNKWFSSIEYRKEIAKKLYLPFSDKELNKVAKAGSGSSFDGLKYDNQAQKMDVLHRYKLLENDERMLYVKNNKAVIEMTTKIFGNIY